MIYLSSWTEEGAYQYSKLPFAEHSLFLFREFITIIAAMSIELLIFEIVIFLVILFIKPRVLVRVLFWFVTTLLKLSTFNMNSTLSIFDFIFIKSKLKIAQSLFNRLFFIFHDRSESS